MGKNLFFKTSDLSEDQEQLLSLIKDNRPSVEKINTVLVFSSDDPKLVEAVDLITADWISRLNLVDEVNQVEPAEDKAQKKESIRNRPNGTCLKCFRKAQIVKVDGLCKPCHMLAIKEQKKLEREGVLPAGGEDLSAVDQTEDEPKEDKKKRAKQKKLTNEEIAANIERIVAQDRAGSGMVEGANVEKTVMAIGHSLMVHKLG